jgi:hypothetical protein
VRVFERDKRVPQIAQHHSAAHFFELLKFFSPLLLPDAWVRVESTKASWDVFRCVEIFHFKQNWLAVPNQSSSQAVSIFPTCSFSNSNGRFCEFLAFCTVAVRHSVSPFGSHNAPHVRRMESKLPCFHHVVKNILDFLLSIAISFCHNCQVRL